MLVVIDDLHWADEASLRWIAYLAPRIDGLPLLLALATRPPEQSPEPGFLSQILSDPTAVVLRPGPLGAESAAVLARAAFGAQPDPEFVTACQSATGGNPLFLRAVLGMLAREHIAPTAANASRVVRTGPAEITRLVSRGLARLPQEATSLIQAAAVLGDGAPLELVAELSDLDGEGAARAAAALVRAELLRNEDPVEFMHPVIRTAIYGQIAGDERRRAHRRAGELLAAAGAPVEQAAAHLSATLPAGPQSAPWPKAHLEPRPRFCAGRSRSGLPATTRPVCSAFSGPLSSAPMPSPRPSTCTRRSRSPKTRCGAARSPCDTRGLSPFSIGSRRLCTS